jgi:hypothetical protein
MSEAKAMVPDQTPAADDNVVALVWAVIRWTIAAIIGGIGATFGFILRQTWVNAQLLAEIKHDTKNIRAIQVLQAETSAARHQELLRRVEHLEDRAARSQEGEG